MGVTTSLPALTYPLQLHAYREASCDDYPEGWCDYVLERWHSFYVADWLFARGIVYFCCGTIGLFTLIHAVSLIRERRRGTAVAKPSGISKITAFARGVFGTQFRYATASTGGVALIMTFIVFCTAMTFGPRPYYWPAVDGDAFALGHSPPIGTRSGWLALGCLPFLIMLASKLNPITMLTGISHEKLQIYHRWTSWVMRENLVFLSLVHTFAFLIYPVKGGGMEMLTMDWETNSSYWTGVLCVIPQFAMSILALAPIRNRWYEMFKIVHILLAIMFVITLFIHCAYVLSSWDYFIGLGTFYICFLILRWSLATFRNGFSHIATIDVLDPTLFLVRIPTRLKWTAGQHYFFRFAGLGGLNTFTSHPFTVASVPVAGKGEESMMELMIKVRGGITAKLASSVGSGRVLLDGPYGGLQGKLGVYDHVLLMAGGSGASVILSALRDLATRSVSKTQPTSVVYTTSSAPTLEFVDHTISSLKCNPPIALYSHLTKGKDTSETSSVTDSPLEKDVKDMTALGRPCLADHVRRITSLPGSVAVVACGPDAFNRDVKAAVAEAQWRIVKGKTETTECWLHAESFSW